MTKKLLLVFFIIASFKQINAQSLVRPYAITSDTATQQFLDNNYWQVLADKNSSFTIGEVQKEPLTDQFVYLTKNSKTAFTETTWFRFNLKNNTGKNLNLSIASNAAVADFYIPDSNGIMHHYLTGNEITWRKKDGFKKDNAIPFEIKQGQQIMIYLKTLNRTFLSDTLKFPLFNTQKLERSILHNYQENYTSNSHLFAMVLSGIFFLDGIFILLIYFTVKEKIYLYFSLFSFFGCLGYLNPLYSVEHINYALSVIIFDISIFLWPFFIFQFVRKYLQVSKYYPRWNKFIGIVMYLFFASIFERIASVYHVKSSDWFFIGIVIHILFWVSFIITIIIFFLKITRDTRAFLIGVLPLTLCILCSTLVELGAIFSIFLRNFITNSISHFGYANGIASVWLMVIISWTLFKRFANQEKKLAQEKLEKEQLAKEQEIQKRELIAQQKVELERQVVERTSELKQSLEELKSTQSQLIQSEKMASLGELTAGIAHEIQNPLNFVNNFSDVNQELLIEMKDEIEKGNSDEAKAIANDVIENEQKINHHGKRADAIVKGMLQHSRQSSGKKEPTDINALADEYLRLSYHGLRAKDKTFNAELKTDFDGTIGKINVIPQDIGRVLLNLFNNAFYAVSERQKAEGGKLNAERHYQPSVFVTTVKCDDKVQIIVKDNGNGIPQKIVDKIFQPFFTTKPTGEGTGLGLSLAYDIIKAHGGSLKVESKEGEGSEFVIQLPGGIKF
jgi:two-component system, NtrC family, sensor kinase